MSEAKAWKGLQRHVWMEYGHRDNCQSEITSYILDALNVLSI